MRTLNVDYQKTHSPGGPHASSLVLWTVWLIGLMMTFWSCPTFSVWGVSSDIHIQAEPPFFSPNALAVISGTSLTWKNFTHEAHSIVSDDCTRLSGCSFDSGLLRPNEHFLLPTLKAGRYPYHCGLHPFMRGLLTIHPPPTLSSDI